jgi:hypothetical protein
VRNCVFEHLPVTGRIAERRVRSAADHQVDAFRLAGVVVVEQKLGFFSEDRPTILVVAILCSPALPTTCSSGMPYLFGIDADKVLGRRQPLPRLGLELLSRHSGERGAEDLFDKDRER